MNQKVKNRRVEKSEGQKSKSQKIGKSETWTLKNRKVRNVRVEISEGEKSEGRKIRWSEIIDDGENVGMSDVMESERRTEVMKSERF